MTAPQPDARAFSPSRRRRLGPLTLLAAGAAAAAALWAGLQLWLHLIGIAASPLGWLLSWIGAVAGLVSAKGG